MHGSMHTKQSQKKPTQDMRALPFVYCVWFYQTCPPSRLDAIDRARSRCGRSPHTARPSTNATQPARRVCIRHGRTRRTSAHRRAWRRGVLSFTRRPTCRRRGPSCGHVAFVALMNEPHAASWGFGKATDWDRGATRLGNKVLQLCPRWMVMVEGVGYKPGAPDGNDPANCYWWGENLVGARVAPGARVRHGPGLGLLGPRERRKVIVALGGLLAQDFGSLLVVVRAAEPQVTR